MMCSDHTVVHGTCPRIGLNCGCPGRRRLALIVVAVAGFALASCGQREEVLARVGARTITPHDLREALSRTAGGGSPETNPRVVFGALVTRALLLEAASHLRSTGELGPVDSLPAIGSHKRTRQVEDRWLDAVYRVEVIRRVAIPDSAYLRAEWNFRPPRLQAATLAVVTFGDSATAMELRATQRGRSLREACRLLSPPVVPVIRSLLFPTGESLWQRLEPMLAAMRAHQARGPLRVGGEWVFVELLDRKLRRFDDLAPDEIARLRQDALEHAREARFGAVVDSLSAAIGPQIFYDRLDRVHLSGRAHAPLVAVAWVFLITSVIGLALRFAPYPGAKQPAGLRHLAGMGIQVGLVGLLVIGGVRYLAQGGGGWDFANYHRAAREMRAGLSPYDPATVARDEWDPATPFLYAPITLWLFRPLSGLPLEKALVAWFWIKVGVALALGVLIWRLLSGRVPAVLLVAMILFGFNGALLIDLRSGNVSSLEALLLLCAMLALIGGRRWACACLIAMAAQFKLLPIAFVSLLAWPTRNPSRRAGPILAGLGLFALLLTLPSLASMPWAKGYLHNLESTRPYGEVNPSALGLLDTVLARGSSNGGRGSIPLALWAVYCGALLAASAGEVRRTWREQDPMRSAMMGIMLFILLSPRPIVYGYALAVTPALWIVTQLWPRAPGMALAVAVLSSQGLILRGIMGADYSSPHLPWLLLVAVSNLPFLMALGLWLAYVRARGIQPNDGPRSPAHA